MATATFVGGPRGGLLVAGGLMLVAIIALLDYVTGPNLSLSIVYLLPVAACAWWGGFPHGILLSLGGAVAWHWVDTVENPAIPTIFLIWNGVVRFGTLVLTSSLVTRVRLGALREQLLARTDALTGAANGRTFYEEAAADAERALRASRPLTLAYLDLDNFKQLNDRLGHAIGDAALVHLVSTIRPHLRSTDLLARLGGDEFALLLPGTEGDSVVAVLDRLTDLVSQEMTRKGWPVTVSIGAITFVRPPPDVDLMIQQVDALMYGAKRKGKGRVEHAVLHDAQDFPVVDSRCVEKRATARVLCNRSAWLLPDSGGGAGQFATVRDLSAGGIGLHLEKRLPRDTVVTVEPLCPGGKTLLARVVRAVAEGEGWVHGCVLSPALNAEELSACLEQCVAKG